MNRPRVLVIGGGLAGLAAAVSCVDAGASVTLLEARRRLGGAATSFRRGDLVIDTGQHVVLRCCTDYLSFLERLGTADGVAFQPRLDVPLLAEGGRRGRLRRSAFLPAPAHLAASVLRFPFLPVTDRVQVARAALQLARTDRIEEDLDDRTFAAWLRDHGQSPVGIERFWDLIALPTLNLPSEAVSADLAAMVFQTGFLGDPSAADIGIPTVPLAELHASPAANLVTAAGGEIRTATRAVAVTRARRGLSVRTQTGTLSADGVVVAVPPRQAKALLPAEVTPPDARALGAVPIVNVHLHLDRPVLDVPFAASVTGPVQWVFDRTAPSGVKTGQLLSISISGADEEIGLRSEELCDLHTRALADLLPDMRRAQVLDRLVTRDRAATFRQAPGVQRLRPTQRTAVPGLALAGAWTDTGWPATMEGAVRSGRAAASSVLRDVERGRVAEVAA